VPYALRDAQGHQYPVGAKTQIGRDRTNQVALTDPQASRVHATVWEEQGTLFLRDERSANGTMVNGHPVQQTGLRPGDQILIGNTTLFVVQTAGPAGAVSAPAQPVQGAPKAKGRGCGRWLLVGCLVLGLGGVVLAVGGFVAYQSGLLTVDSALNLIGLGPADVEVDNFRDDTIQVAIVQLDAPADSLPMEVSLEINPFDIRTYRLQNPGRYRMDFNAGAADLGTCTLNVKSGDEFQFVALPDGIVINPVDDPVSVGSDLVVATSALCR